MDFALTESQELIRKEVAALSRSFSHDYWLEKDRTAEYPWEFVKAFADGGWLGHHRAGGIRRLRARRHRGRDHAARDLRLGRGHDAAPRRSTSTCSRRMPVIRHGSEAMKQRYLPASAAGDTMMAFGVTEPNAGTDTSRIQTRAEKKGDRWIVNGRKVWTTNAQNAKRILLLARTSPRDARARRRHDAVLHRLRPRRRCTVREIDKLGRAAVDSNEVFIDGLEVPDETSSARSARASTTCSTR